MKKQINLLLLSILLFPAIVFAQNKKEDLPPVLFEHLHINVADKEATAKWYVDNIDLEILESANEEVIYVADKDHHFMFEFSTIDGIKNSYFDVDINAYHMAFEGHSSIETIAKNALKKGAVQEGNISTNKVGDFVLNLRDINGFVCQLIHRVDMFYDQPSKSAVRFEHFAYNTPDQKNTALWYIQFMNLNIAWSKDIRKDSLMWRNYRVPYLGDQANRMTLELFAKDVPVGIANLPHEVVHIALSCDEPHKLAKQMVYGGAKKVSDSVNAQGDIIIDIYDPIGVPLRILKRKKPLLL